MELTTVFLCLIACASPCSITSAVNSAVRLLHSLMLLCFQTEPSDKFVVYNQSPQEYVALEPIQRRFWRCSFIFDYTCVCACPCMHLIYTAQLSWPCSKAALPAAAMRLQVRCARPAKSKFLQSAWKIRKLDSNNSGFVDEERSVPC